MLDAAAVKARVDLLDLVRRYSPRPDEFVRTPRGIKGPCMLHDDHNPSFSGVDESKFLTCFKGCFSGDVIAFVMKMEGVGFNEALRLLALWYAPDLLPPDRAASRVRSSGKKAGKAPAPIAAIYPYTNESGDVLFEKVRLEPKDFYIRRPDGQGGYIRGLGDLPRVLYQLPKVRTEKHLVILVEGEKDVHSGEALGLDVVFTCNPFGAKDWRREYSLALQGTERMLIISDNDPEGIAHTARAKADLKGLVGQVRTAVMPHGKDLTEWVEGGGTAEQFREWVEQQFQAAEPESSTQTTEVSEPAESPTESLPAKCPVLPEAAWYGLSKKYREIATPRTEASHNYHLACFLIGVGSCLGRTVHTEIAEKLYPNLFACLIGPSGGARKGAAMNYGIKLAQALNNAIGILPSLDSSEGFIDHLEKFREKQGGGETVSAIVQLSELRSLIDKSSIEGLRSIIPTLCKAYDCPPSLDILTRNRPVSVRQPTVSLLAGTTMRWLEKVRPEDLEGGLGNRIMWVPGEPGEPIPKAPDFKQREWNGLIQQLGDSVNFWRERKSTGLSFSRDADERWKQIYQELYTHRKDDELIAILCERLQNHCVKTALIHAALDHSSVIEKDHMEAAYAFTAFLYDSLWYLFRGFGMSPMAQLDQKIIHAVKEAGGKIRRPNLKHRFWRTDMETFNRRLDSLTRTDGPLVPVTEGQKVFICLADY